MDLLSFLLTWVAQRHYKGQVKPLKNQQNEKNIIERQGCVMMSQLLMPLITQKLCDFIMYNDHHHHYFTIQTATKTYNKCYEFTKQVSSLPENITKHNFTHINCCSIKVTIPMILFGHNSVKHEWEAVNLSSLEY